MMKKIFMVLIAVAFLAACNSAAEKKDPSATDQVSPASEWVEVTLNVEGMTCEGCENAIKAGVESLDGIASVEASFVEGWTKVKYDRTQTSVEAIEGKITDTGYTVKDISR